MAKPPKVNTPFSPETVVSVVPSGNVPATLAVVIKVGNVPSFELEYISTLIDVMSVVVATVPDAVIALTL